MKKSVLLVIATTVLFSLPAFAGQKKFESWQGYWVWTPQAIKEFPIKMKIPWFIKIENEKDWEIWLEQIDCAALGRGSDDWPCFRGCNELKIACNFNCTLLAGVNKKYLGGQWGTSVIPEDINAPGGTATVCVKLWKADLMGMPAGTDQTVAEVSISVVPR